MDCPRRGPFAGRRGSGRDRTALRRVLLAFSVKPEDVRFIATSATIGSGETVREQLQRFLADVAGIRDDRVHVIEGGRQMPRRPDGEPVGPSIDIRSADPVLIYDILGRDPALNAS